MNVYIVVNVVVLGKIFSLRRMSGTKNTKEKGIVFDINKLFNRELS